MKRFFVLIAAAATATFAFADTPPIQRVPHSHRNGTALFVRAADGPLIFTAQVYAADLSRDARGQAGQALDQIGLLLAKAGGDLTTVLRLNVYLADERSAAAVDALLAERFDAAPPAVTTVVSPLSQPGALVAFDAVAAVKKSPAAVEVITSSAAILPAGGKVFISGQAEKAADLATATQLTMESLHRSLAHLGLTKTDVVQVKAFIQPFVDHAVVTAAVARSFAPAPMPPLVLVEWISPLPTEIELVAAAGSTTSGTDPLTFPTLPGMSVSTRFSRVARVAAGTPLIFISGIDGGTDGSLSEQWQRIFSKLGSALFDAGSSFRHLVKTTYYLDDPAGTAPLGAIRDVYFDPARPPAASAVRLKGTARPHLALDLVAVPAK